MTLLVGEPIDPPKGDVENVDKAVQELHHQYMESVKALYDKYKDVYAKDRVKDLEFVE